MKYNYASIYNKSAAFYRAHPIARRILKISNRVFSGLFIACYPLLYLLALLNPTHFHGINGWLAIAIPPAIALLLVTLLRTVIKRHRPYAEQGAGIKPLIKKHSADDCSFPSRHLACAAVIAMTYLPFYPIIGGVLLAVSLLLGYIRFALGLHYPSDLFLGEGIGLLIGLLCFLFI